jgi:hypothetical protein
LPVPALTGTNPMLPSEESTARPSAAVPNAVVHELPDVPTRPGLPETGRTVLSIGCHPFAIW